MGCYETLFFDEKEGGGGGECEDLRNFIHTLLHDDVRKLIDDGEGFLGSGQGGTGELGRRRKNPFAWGVGVRILGQRREGEGEEDVCC